MQWEINHRTQRDNDIRVEMGERYMMCTGIIHDLGFGIMHTIIKKPKYIFDQYSPVHYLPLYSLN